MQIKIKYFTERDREKPSKDSFFKQTTLILGRPNRKGINKKQYEHRQEDRYKRRADNSEG